jgi:hypothetical protein
VSQHVHDRSYNLYRNVFYELARDTLTAAGIQAPATTARKLWGALASEIKMKRGHPTREDTARSMQTDCDELCRVIRRACLEADGKD